MVNQKAFTGKIFTFAVIATLVVAVSAVASERTWTSIRESKWKAAFFDVYFVDAQHGWIVGERSSILHTVDGGKTWNNQPSQPLPFKKDLKKVRFINSQIGWVVGEEGTILKTLDGGATWMKLNSGTRAALSSVSFFDAQFGWAGGDGGVIIHTVRRRKDLDSAKHRSKNRDQQRH